MIQVRILIDHVRLRYHQIVVVIHQFVIYMLLLVVQNDVVQHHYDLIDLLIVELYHVNLIILFVNHEP